MLALPSRCAALSICSSEIVIDFPLLENRKPDSVLLREAVLILLCDVEKLLLLPPIMNLFAALRLSSETLMADSFPAVLNVGKEEDELDPPIWMGSCFRWPISSS